jgi:amino acid adenylation domain-containing protein
MAYLLQQLLTASARRDPHKEVALCRALALTYQELDETSDRLAGVLQQSGVERGDRVGIYLNKSLESLAALFGILKAGAVYVPLDPSAPVKRVAFIVGNCAMKGLVSTAKKIAHLSGALPESSALRCVVLTDGSPPGSPGSLARARMVGWQEIQQSPRSFSNPPVIEDDLAYILYTSGSTGEPKGVMISHRAALTFVNWAQECIGVQAADRVSNHAPLHFDLSIFDIFTTIKSGGTVVAVPEEVSLFPRDLADFIENERITVWYSVPSALTQLVLHGEPQRHRLASLCKILFAGEVFPVKYLRQLQACVPHARYYNLYGPTETNVCTYHAIPDIAPDREEPFPIGRACANTEVFAVTDRQELALPGEVGELYVRGPGLAKGYWGLPDRTREAFLANPTGTPLGQETVYRTGDLVKQDADGNYLFLGRRDDRIKSRGYRIELGEIETVLNSHPQVEEVAVVPIPDEAIGNLIKAFVVARTGCEVTRAQLEGYCAERLPKYMLPRIIEFRSALPKTSTGKLDKRLLREQHPWGPAAGSKGGSSWTT